MPIVKTAILLAVMTALFGAAGWLIGGAQGALIALLIAAGMNAYAVWNSDQAVLRMHGARRVTKAEAPDLVGMVEEMAARAGLPMPAVYIIDSDQPNAFATGRNPENAAVAATRGLLQRLSREEVAGVMAHELAHVKSRDTLLMAVAATLAGAVGVLGNLALFSRGGRDNPMGMIGVLAVMIGAPFAAGIVQMAISRTREYEADRIGAEICGHPGWLASALAKIHEAAARIDNHQAERHPATAHMFIINPLHAHAADKLFSTHPDVRNRIAALRAMTGAPDGAPDGAAMPQVERRRPPLPQEGPTRGPWG